MASDDTSYPGDDPQGVGGGGLPEPRQPLDEETWLRLQRGDGESTAVGPEPTAPQVMPPPSVIDPVLDRPLKKPSDIDLEMDPLLRLEERHASMKGALVFALAIPLVTIITGGVIAAISRWRGGPLCDGGLATWICTRTFEIIFPVVPGAVSFLGLIGAAIICYSKSRRDLYWQPWLGIMWILMPFTILWATGVGTMAVVGHH